MKILDYFTCLLRNQYTDQEATVRTLYWTTDWFRIDKGECQGCLLSSCWFNLYAESILRNARLIELQARIYLFWSQCCKSKCQLQGGKKEKLIIKKKKKKTTNMWGLNNTLLNNQQITGKSKTEIKICIVTNDNENRTSQNLWDAVKAVLRGKFIAMQAYIKKQAKHLINKLTLHLKQPEKEQHKTPMLVEGKRNHKSQSRT